MNMREKPINTIYGVIETLEYIIQYSEKNNDPSGYFAALYQRVTIKVKEEIENNYFDDGPRMEQLDVLFANRYIDAWVAHKAGTPISASWSKAFELATDYWPIVLQHLLLGMNAHINFDLGISAAEVSRGKKLDELHPDFNRINEILSSLVHEVQDNLSVVWPALKYILKWTGKIDDYLVDFSMKLARDGAWKFATEVSGTSDEELEACLSRRDQRVARKVSVIIQPGMIAAAVLTLVRLTERGTVPEKIRKLKRAR
ncbi:DUF5995 family protein [uncultured Sunxiuqinia sp.]|uniref:DUF5995 family protein n=1 Tax=uncultured Sunxiuqinia sp. TaxID=1573825 RepID=UPI0030DA1538|tara:strand:- start:814 stop:1584 length:771 start_codon:yes stop_codon:yes gene_type:complete